MSNVVNTYAGNILGMFDSVVEKVKANQQIIKQCDDETNDLLHEIEIAKPKNACEGYMLYKALKDVRLKRRAAKDENRMLDELYQFCNKQNKVKEKLQTIQDNAARTEVKLSTRQYTPRARQDLTIAENKPSNVTTLTPKSNNSFEKMMREFRKGQGLQKKYKYM